MILKNRPFLTQEMVLETTKIGVGPEDRIANHRIADSQGLKPVSAYHYEKDDRRTLLKSSILNKHMVTHPDQDRDITPLGLDEPHEGLKRAHMLSYADHLRVKSIKDREHRMRFALKTAIEA